MNMKYKVEPSEEEQQELEKFKQEFLERGGMSTEEC